VLLAQDLPILSFFLTPGCKTGDSGPERWSCKTPPKLSDGAALTPEVHAAGEQGLSVVKGHHEERRSWEQKPGQPGNVRLYQGLFHQRFRLFCYQEVPGPARR